MSGWLRRHQACLIAFAIPALVFLPARPSFGQERGVGEESKSPAKSAVSPAEFTRFSPFEREVLAHWLGLYVAGDEDRTAVTALRLNLNAKDVELWRNQEEGPLVPLRVDEAQRVYLPLGKDSRRAILQVFQARGHLLRTKPIRLTIARANKSATQHGLKHLFDTLVDFAKFNSSRQDRFLNSASFTA